MPSVFMGLDLASRALRSFQRAMDVTGHNIANVNTRGYSRQTVDFTQTDPMRFYANGMHTLGTGVTISSVNRIRDLFLDARMQGASAELGRSSSSLAGLAEVEGVFGEPSDSGIGNALTKFFDSWSGLASNPGDRSARLSLRAAGATLTDRVRGAYQNLQILENQNSTRITDTIRQINSLGSTIQQLNLQIQQHVVSGGEANDLLDQRNQAIQDLASLADITTSDNMDGTIDVHINEFTLVQGAGAFTYPSTYDPVTKTVSDGTYSYRVDSGVLRGHFDSVEKIRSMKSQLDTFANELKTQINALHTTGLNPNGTTGINFFDDVAIGNPQNGAVDFKLDAAILTDVKNISAGTSGNDGDGALASSLSAVRSGTFAALGNATFSDYYMNGVNQLAQDVQVQSQSEDFQNDIVAQVQNQIDSVSGVSLDEEMANMLRYQRSYQAAAKLLTTFDQVTEDLLGMLRR